jgi:hypothetical protein
LATKKDYVCTNKKTTTHDLALRQRISAGPITWSIFNPGVELSPVYRVEISALSVIQNSIKIKRAIT